MRGVLLWVMVLCVTPFVAGVCVSKYVNRLEAQEPITWSAFAQVEPVEGKKPKPDNPDKHRHDDFEPTPAPPKPDDGEFDDPDFGRVVPEPIPKRPKVIPVPDRPDHSKPDRKPKSDDSQKPVVPPSRPTASWGPSGYDAFLAVWCLALTGLVAYVIRSR